MMHSRLVRAVQFAFGFGILYLLFQQAEAEQALAALRAIPLENAAMAILVFLISSLLLGVSLLIFLSASIIRHRTGRVLQAHLAGVLFSDVTPSRLGYLLTPLLLERLAGLPREMGIAALARMQAVSLITKAVIAWAAVLLLGHRLEGQTSVAQLVSYVVAASVILAAAGFVVGLVALTPIMNTAARFLSENFAERGSVRFLRPAIKFAEKFRAGGRETYRRALLAAALAAASTLAAGVALYPIARAVGLTRFDILEIIAVGVIVGPLVYLPISPAGIGVMEAAYVLVLTALGQDRSVSLAFALATRVLVTGTDLVGLPWLLKSLNGAPTIAASRAVGRSEPLGTQDLLRD